MEYQKMILAAKVLELAEKIANSERQQFVLLIEDDLESRDARLKNWDAENPISSFVPRAHKNIRNAALQIDEIQSLST
ncbi:hypothetical protein ACQ4WP_26875 [Janthinobacterium sp. GB4P2]|uniref:hypothetical protein n=1 Tax=Janthinobacterium sp. GB4P2 TaxID=3424189 RepID=UPI003F242728